MDLATRIRMDLADGKSPDQVVEELTAAGMTEATARRHVDRARSIPAAPTLLLEPPIESTGKWALIQTELSVMLMWDFDADAKQCARDAFARLLRSRDELKRLTTIHTLGHEGGGMLFDELLRSAAEHDPSEQNRRTARATLERRLQARKR